MKKNKRNKQLNATEKRIKELHSILDKNYFHVCTSINNKYIDGVSWKVYYKNLPTQQYYSRKNRELLSSDKNTIEDIYKLKNKFEKEKAKIINENAYEYSHISHSVFNVMYETKKEFINNFEILMFLILIASIVNLFTFKCLEFSILSTLLTGFIAIFGSYILEQIDKLRGKVIREIQDNYVRERIRRQGLYFVKRLKDDI